MRAVLREAAIFQTKLPTKFHKTSAKHRILKIIKLQVIIGKIYEKLGKRRKKTKKKEKWERD